MKTNQPNQTKQPSFICGRNTYFKSYLKFKHWISPLLKVTQYVSKGMLRSKKEDYTIEEKG